MIGRPVKHKFTPEQLQQIREWHIKRKALGGIKDLARKFGVAPNSVALVIKRQKRENKTRRLSVDAARLKVEALKKELADAAVDQMHADAIHRSLEKALTSAHSTLKIMIDKELAIDSDPEYSSHIDN